MDIVERLRMRPEREMLYIDGCVSAGYGPTVEARAADEIELLRRERDALAALLREVLTCDDLSGRAHSGAMRLQEKIEAALVRKGE